MRVVGGSARGRRLAAPPGRSTRPTSEFVREAIFDTLQPLVAWEGLAVADLFAGSGALGIEALSRGAASCVFVETAKGASDAIRTNLRALGAEARCTIVRRPVERWIPIAPTFDVAFADPPYSFDGWGRIGELRASLVVAESDRPVVLGGRWEILRTKRYGGTVVTLFEPRSEAP